MNPTKMRAWVTAVMHLGLGWIPPGRNWDLPLPDPSQALAQALPDMLPKKKVVPLVGLISKIGKEYPLLDYAQTAELPFGLSFALRSLHDRDVVCLSHLPDAEAPIRLFRDPGHPINKCNRVERRA